MFRVQGSGLLRRAQGYYIRQGLGLGFKVEGLDPPVAPVGAVAAHEHAHHAADLAIRQCIKDLPGVAKRCSEYEKGFGLVWYRFNAVVAISKLQLGWFSSISSYANHLSAL